MSECAGRTSVDDAPIPFQYRRLSTHLYQIQLISLWLGALSNGELTTGQFLVEKDNAEGYANAPSLIEEVVEQT